MNAYVLIVFRLTAINDTIMLLYPIRFKLTFNR